MLTIIGRDYSEKWIKETFFKKIQELLPYDCEILERKIDKRNQIAICDVESCFLFRYNKKTGLYTFIGNSCDFLFNSLYIGEEQMLNEKSFYSPFAESYDIAVEYINENNCPKTIFLQKEMGKGKKNGIDFIKRLIEKDKEKDIIPNNFTLETKGKRIKEIFIKYKKKKEE